MVNQSESRKIAYQYVVAKMKNTMWVTPIDSDKRVAEVLDIPIDDLNSLKEGLSDPSPKLIEEFKKFVGQTTPEDEVDAYLVTPFSTRL